MDVGPNEQRLKALAEIERRLKIAARDNSILLWIVNCVLTDSQLGARIPSDAIATHPELAGKSIRDLLIDGTISQMYF